MEFIVKWLSGHALTFGLRRLLKPFLTEDVQKGLRQAAKEWSKTLPDDIPPLTIEAVLPQPPSVGVQDPPPCPSEIFDRLAKSEIPDASAWFSGLFGQWQWVRKNIEGPHAFFLLPEADACVHLRELATRLELECQKNQQLFQVTVLKAIQKNESLLAEISDRVIDSQDATKRSYEASGDISRQLDRLLSALQATQPSSTRGQEKGFHAEIDAAAAFTQSAQPDIAIVQLERLQKEQWDQLTNRERFRVLANIGHAYHLKEDEQRAARYFIDCKQYQPEDEQARCLEAIGKSLRNEKQIAFDLAQGIRTDFPSSDLAYATWIRNAPDQFTFDELELATPVSLRSEIETSMALSWRALHDGDLPKAVSYARTAIAKDSGSPLLLENLAVALIESARSEAAEQFSEAPAFSQPTNLDEARSHLLQALDGTPQHLLRRRARLRYYLAIVYQLKGLWDDAHDELHAAYDAVKTNPEYARQYALSLADRSQIGRAIPTLRQVVAPDTSRRNAVLLAHLLCVRNQDGDQSEAIELLSGELANLDAIDALIRCDIVAMLVDLYARSDRHELASATVDTIPVEAIGNESRHAIKATQLRLAGDIESAIAEIEKAVHALSAQSPRKERRRVAIELVALGRYVDALPLLKAIVSPKSIAIDLRTLLYCADFCSDDRFITEYCADLRHNGFYDREALHLEIDTLQEYNCFDRAIAVMQEYLKSANDCPLAREIRARLSHLAILLARDEFVEHDPSRLPRVTEVEPPLGLAVVEILSHGPEPERGVEYAYELLRKHFASHFAHKAVVMSFLLGHRRELRIDEPSVAGPGCAVRYKETGASHSQWFIIEDGPDPDLARYEYPSTHSLSLAVAGKRKGDEFVLKKDAVKERSARVEEVWSKYKYRFNRCMEEWEDRFPEQYFLWRFEVRKDAAGTPDIDPILQSVDQRIEQVGEYDEVYRTNPLSLSNFAVMTGSSILESLEHLGADPKLPIRCCAGTDDEQEQALQCFKASRPFILDGTALSTLYVTKLFDKLAGVGFEYVVSSGTLQEWRRRYLERLHSHREGGFLTKDGDRYVLIKESPEDLDRRLGEFRAFVELIESNTRVEDGMALADVARDNRDELIAMFGRPAAETIAIASLNDYVLWTDDMAVAAFATQQGVRGRIWTDAVSQWAFDVGHIAREVRDATVVGLIQRRYFYTRLIPDAVLWAGEHCGWSVTNSMFSSLLDWFSNPFTKQEGVCALAAELLKGISRRAKAPFYSDIALMQLLRNIMQRPDGRGIIARLYRNIDSICGVDARLAHNLRDFFQKWKAMHPVA